MGGKNRKTVFSTIITAAALAALTSCAPKKPFTASKTPLSENKPVPVLFSEWNGGTCSFNALEERVKYKDKESKITNYFDTSVDEKETVSAIHCSEGKTVLVGINSISVYDQGGIAKTSQVDEDALALLQGGFELPVEILCNSLMFPNEKNEKNILSVSDGSDVFALAKNTETGDLSVTKLSLGYEESVNYYPLGQLFSGNMNVTAHKGLLFIAGEAEKGESYLHVLKVGGKVVGLPFEAKKELKGEVKFGTDYDEQGKNILTLEIGEKKFYIDVEISETRLKGFEDMGDGKTFAKITITK